ncbi:MAG: ATP-binding cassette domain-containing protein [Burkholderiaceae bacterium]
MAGLSFECHSATVRHDPARPAIDAITLRIAAGEQVAVIGPSGAGKSTLLSVLGASLRPHAGTLTIDATDPWSLNGRQLRRLRARLFNAPQAPPLPPRQRVVTAVLAGRLGHWGGARALWSLWRPGEARTAFDALETFSLGDRLWSRVDRLSGGERQRVSLARALVAGAQALLVDEPLAALDPALADQTTRALLDHCRQGGATLVCSLHQVDTALAHFPRVIGLRDGTVVFDDAPRRIDDALIRDLYFGAETELREPLTIEPALTAAVAVMPGGRCAG